MTQDEINADLEALRIDRNAFKVVDIDDNSQRLRDKALTPLERLSHLCFLIRSGTNYDPNASRSSGFFEVVESPV